MKKKLMRIRWLWAIMGFQLLAVGFAIFYNAESDQYLYPAFATFSKPLWVYLPFIIGMLAIYCGISTRSHALMLDLRTDFLLPCKLIA